MDLIVNNVQHGGEVGDFLLEDGLIQEFRTSGSDPGDGNVPVLEGHEQMAVPLLYNAHTHAAMTLFRGFGDDLPLMEWLEEKIWPTEQNLTGEHVYWGTRLACREMMLSGTGFFNDMYWEFEATARAVEDSGLRALLAGVFIDQFDDEIARQQRREAQRNHERSKQFSPRVEYALGPHSIYTVSRDSLEWINRYARDHDLPVHIHLSETEQEVRDCLNEHGMTPVQYLDSLDFLHENLVVAHGIWIEPEEFETLAEAGVSVVYNPISNLKLTAGDDFPWAQYRDHGIPVCLGTDGAASNNNLNLFEEVKLAALIQKNRLDDARQPDAEQAFSMATSVPAGVFGHPGGTLEPGSRADLMLLDPEHPSLTPSHDRQSLLSYSVSPDAITTVVVAGKVLVEDGQPVEEEPVVQRAEECARSLCQEGGTP